jgi:hypothetical protein
MVEELDGMLIRLRLGAIREQLDGLLEEAARRQLNLRETLAWLCAHRLTPQKSPVCLELKWTGSAPLVGH